MKTIVWIHGFPLSSAIFARQRDIDGVRHVMPDLPPLETMDDYARFVLEQVEGKAVFAGFSMGGYIALAIARLAPERMEGLILIDTRETADTPEARKGRYDTMAKVREQGTGVVVESMLPKMLTADAPGDMREYVREIMSSAPKEFVIASLRAMADRPDSTPVLETINVPTLILVGDQDTITPPSDAQRMAAAIKNATLVTIAGAAHLSTIEKADEVNAAVAGFLGSGVAG